MASEVSSGWPAAAQDVKPVPQKRKQKLPTGTNKDRTLFLRQRCLPVRDGSHLAAINPDCKSGVSLTKGLKSEHQPRESGQQALYLLFCSLLSA